MGKFSGKIAVSDVLLWLLAIILLFPIVFFPVSTDLAIYAQAGKTIFNGGKIYVDFIDIKQPLIYYVFALFYFLSHNSESGYRLIDFAYQLITIVFLFRLTLKHSGNRQFAFAAIILYSLSYSTLNYNQTMQTEGFLGLPLIFLMDYILSQDRKKTSSFIAGSVIGILTGMKFSFIIGIFGIFLYDILVEKTFVKNLKTSYWILIAGIFAGFALSCFPFLNGDIYNGYRQTFAYMSFYMSQPPLTSANVSYALKHLAYFWGDNFSVTYLFLLGIGLYTIFAGQQNKKLMKLSLIIFVIYFAGVVVEKKFYPYHFVRMYVPLMILAGYGFYEIAGLWKKFRNERKLFELIALTSLFIIFLPLSPVPRYFNLYNGMFAYCRGEQSYDEYYSGNSSSSNLRSEQKEIACIINSDVTPDDIVTVLSASDYTMNFFLKNVHLSRLALSCFYFNPVKPEEWKKIFLQDISRSRWIIIQTNDWNYHVYGDYKTAFQKALDDDTVSYILQNYFVKTKVSKSYVIFKKIMNKKA